MESSNNLSVLAQVSEIELVYKSKIKASQRPQINSSQDAFDLLLQLWDDGKIDFIEQFKVLLLNRANKVLGICTISTGGVTGTITDPKLIFSLALKGNACGLILSHNHPSGNVKPSKADEEMTQKIKNGSAFLDIKVLDHLIISRETYYSFSDEGLL